MAGTALIMQDEQHQSRRALLTGLASIVTASSLSFGLTACDNPLSYFYPTVAIGFGGVLTVGKVDEFPATAPDKCVLESAGVFHRPFARSYIVHLASTTRFRLTGSQLSNQLDRELFYRDHDGTYWLALYQKCVHMGCTAPFHDSCDSFKCPCHGSHYNVDGGYIGGPATRSLDRFPLIINAHGDVQVDTGKIISNNPIPTPTTRLLPIPNAPCPS
jgi:cytochrome b6-f complex iron-sulfur subunit